MMNWKGECLVIKRIQMKNVIRTIINKTAFLNRLASLTMENTRTARLIRNGKNQKLSAKKSYIVIIIA